NGLQTVPISDDYEFPESSLDALDGDFLSKTYTFNAIFTIDGLPDRFCSISIHLTDNTPPTASCPEVPVILEGDECSEVDVSEHCNRDWFTDNVGIPENICDADKASSTGFDVLPGIPTTVEWQIRDISGVSSEDECTIEFVCQALAPECENLPTIPKFGALACGKKKQGGQQCVLFCHKTKLMILSDTLSTNLINCNGEEWDQTLGGRSCDRVTKPGATEKYVNFSFSSKKCETNPEEFEEHILEVLYNYQEDHDLACKTSENDINKICDAKIKFHCGSKVNNRRRRQLATFITNVTIHFGVSESFSYTGDETVVEAQLLALNTWVQKTVDILQALVTSGNFTIIMNGTVFTADPQSFSSSPLQTVCRSGQVIVGSRCYPCPAGYHHDSLNNTCLSCPYHTYQEQEQQVTCLPCPNGTITIRDGAVGLEECIPGLVDSTSHLSPKVFLALGFIFGFAIGVLALARYCKKQKSNKVTTVKPFVPKNDLQQVIGNDGHAHGYPLKTKDKATSDWVIIPKTLPKGNKITPGPMHLSAWDTCCTDPKASMDPGRVLLPRTPIPPNKIVVRDKGTPPPQVPNIVESDC
ncbi:PREDICTED: sushi, von Willebrand factor type A, EGF and pentraxin domain-containing protein 1-like, partial [Branchiostoma belcheri]|uniref:Sushi, von Willebrand factor type A, EGF and pentraxin domain-containing protein 1-like n=1 Tax=Branchiostoma belcheri TaxID=7741 RepID=A0A6P4Z4C1_BRABE